MACDVLLRGIAMVMSFESVRMGTKEVSERWLKASRALMKEDRITGLTACFLEVFPDLLDPSMGDFHIPSDLLCSHPLLLLTNDPVYFLPVQLHIP